VSCWAASFKVPPGCVYYSAEIFQIIHASYTYIWVRLLFCGNPRIWMQNDVSPRYSSITWNRRWFKSIFRLNILLCDAKLEGRTCCDLRGIDRSGYWKYLNFLSTSLKLLPNKPDRINILSSKLCRFSCTLVGESQMTHNGSDRCDRNLFRFFDLII
jgi:hypothetical protein